MWAGVRILSYQGKSIKSSSDKVVVQHNNTGELSAHNPLQVAIIYVYRNARTLRVEALMLLDSLKISVYVRIPISVDKVMIHQA